MQKAIDYHYEVRGKTLKWFSVDNPKRAQYEAPIEYRFNSHGFRMDIEMWEIEEGCDIYIGDSTTLAFGLNPEEGWAYKHNTKEQFVNLSQAGAGMDTVTRLLGYWVPILKPENVYIQETAPNRQEFLNADGVGWSSAYWYQVSIQKFGDREITDESYFKEKLFIDLVSQEQQVNVQRQKNLDAIQWICRDTKIHFADLFPTNSEFIGASRDGFHPGAKQQDKILDRFIGVKKSSPLPSFW
jgi:hypothetical protein